MTLKALIDADPICYRIAFACKEDTPADACRSMNKYLAGVLLAVDHDNREYYNWQLFLSDSTANNFRTAYAVTAPYKGNRGEKPAHLPVLRTHLMEQWQAMLCEGEEADDAIAQRANADTIVVSVDKDLLQVPGWHYNNVSGVHQYITPEQGMLNFYCQILTGDKVDNIIGINGVGPVKARKRLEDAATEREMYERCVEAYDGNEARVIENGRLLWLRRTANQIWEPPNVPA
jgi:hypothetical protein